MTISPHLRIGNDALSRQVKAGVTPIEKPERRKKGAKGLARTQMQRKPAKLKRGPVGHASAAQKEKILREGLRIAPVDWWPTAAIDPAHVCPRAIGGCDSEDCVIPLTRQQHRQYDEGKLDILPYLTLVEQSHVVGHLGILGALKRTTGEAYVPERLLRAVSDDGETG